VLLAEIKKKNAYKYFAAKDLYNTNTNKIYIAPGILKRIGAQTHGVTRRNILARKFVKYHFIKCAE